MKKVSAFQLHIQETLAIASQSHMERTGVWPFWVIEQPKLIGVTDGGRMLVQKPSYTIKFHCECHICMNAEAQDA